LLFGSPLPLPSPVMQQYKYIIRAPVFINY
jgi:hypothetical protein